MEKEHPNINVDKVGNLIIYLADKINSQKGQSLLLTKLLKLLYIIDETAVRETGAPVTGFDYRVWKMGPVAYDIYREFMHQTSNYFSTFAEGKKRTKLGSQEEYVLINSVNKFKDDEFSDYEIELVDKIIEKFGQYSGEELIEILHEKDTLWSRIVKQKALEEVFAHHSNTSNYKIDLSDVISNDPFKKQIFITSQDALRL